MSTLDRDGVRLAYDEAGSGGPPVVLLHGWACDRRFMAPLFDHFRLGHRVVNLDFRGHGESDMPVGEYTVALLADDVAWACRELGLHGPVVVGHSLGGQVAMELAARSPDVPGAVVALDATVVPPEGTGAFLDSFTAALHSPAYADAVQGFLGLAFAPFDDPSVKAWVLDAVGAAPQHVVAPLWDDGLIAWDGAAAAAGCRVPTLYVDHGAPNCDLARLRSLMPQLMTGQTVGAGHFAPLLVPTQAASMIEGFLAAAALLVVR